MIQRQGMAIHTLCCSGTPGSTPQPPSPQGGWQLGTAETGCVCPQEVPDLKIKASLKLPHSTAGFSRSFLLPVPRAAFSPAESLGHPTRKVAAQRHGL